MLIRLNDRTRELLVQSLPFMKRNQAALTEGIAAYLHASDPRTSSEDAGLMARSFVSLLLDQAGRFDSPNDGPSAEDLRREHEVLGIQGRHLSCFGDALVPAIRDVLGRGTPREVSSAWVDGFWAMIRALQPKRMKIAA